MNHLEKMTFEAWVCYNCWKRNPEHSQKCIYCGKRKEIITLSADNKSR